MAAGEERRRFLNSLKRTEHIFLEASPELSVTLSVSSWLKKAPKTLLEGVIFNIFLAWGEGGGGECH